MAPRYPCSASWATSSRSKCSLRSFSRARSTISLSVKLRAVSRISCCSSVRSKSMTGKLAEGGSGEARPRLRQVADGVLEVRDRVRQAVVEVRPDDPDVLDDQGRPRRHAHELVVEAQRRDRVLVPPQQREPAEVAAVGLEEGDLEALDPPLLLEPAPVLHRLVEHLEALGLAPAHAVGAPSDEQSVISHGPNLTDPGPALKLLHPAPRRT